MSLKPCSLFFLKQWDQSKYVVLNNESQLINEHLNITFFPLTATQKKQKHRNSL